MSYITIDSSTSSTTVIVFNEKLEIVKRFQKEHRQIITDEGYIEHDLEEIYQNLLELVKKASEIMSNPKFISLTNQRETFTLFNKNDGKPIHNAVVWQCTRGQKICEDILNDKSKYKEIVCKTGLKPNTFFSGSKLKWVYENKSEVKSKIETYKHNIPNGCPFKLVLHIFQATHTKQKLISDVPKSKLRLRLSANESIKRMTIMDLALFVRDSDRCLTEVSISYKSLCGFMRRTCR